MDNLSTDLGARVRWSDWSRCESSFSMLLVPHRPGILALAEEVLETGATAKRMLGLFHVTEARDLSLAVSALFAVSSPLRERLQQGRCFVRYSMISDPEQRAAVAAALEAWMRCQAEQASGIADALTETTEAVAVSDPVDCDPADCTRAATAGAGARSGPLRPGFPSGF